MKIKAKLELIGDDCKMKDHEFISLMDSYQLLQTILVKCTHCGDENELKHVSNLRLSDISKFIESHKVFRCNNCNGKGVVYIGNETGEFGTKKCPNCDGFGGYFQENEISFDL